MAASTLSEPGSQYGPCERDCGHVDCAAVRKMAGAICRICNVPIGYGIRFYSEGSTHPEGGDVLVHAVCLKEEVEREGAPEVEGPTRANLAEMRERIQAGLAHGRRNGGSP